MGVITMRNTTIAQTQAPAPRDRVSLGLACVVIGGAAVLLYNMI